MSLMSQMGLMTIFALSYNMLMGQAGLLSFGHAIFFGLGGYCTAHALNAIKAQAMLAADRADAAGRRPRRPGLRHRVRLCATKQRATAFAMITWASASW